ncbi:collagens (Type IV and type XIII), and related proteins [Elysia marginata]|uniref:Collagens (Type IV and type XIII), and related proteins n=1 Tax=Elysia marginata TaxID=1093978 RepID=A0AAV4HTH3_9GAST|nr:collagens (Type IV and type XIII), and related proteins [Elysia marginata]
MSKHASFTTESFISNANSLSHKLALIVCVLIFISGIFGTEDFASAQWVGHGIRPWGASSISRGFGSWMGGGETGEEWRDEMEWGGDRDDDDMMMMMSPNWMAMLRYLLLLQRWQYQQPQQHLPPTTTLPPTAPLEVTQPPTTQPPTTQPPTTQPPTTQPPTTQPPTTQPPTTQPPVTSGPLARDAPDLFPDSVPLFNYPFGGFRGDSPLF